MQNDIILLVDDEVKVLSSLSRSLFDDDFGEILTARSGTEALEIVKKYPELPLIISDYHMPGMNGIEFLSQARGISPDTTRILLTGAADLDMAINAVNRGNLFRFLLKPCPADTLIQTVKEGLRYHQLVTAEKELLSKTLSGGIKVMIDILAAQNPFIFAQANRLRKLAQELAIALCMEDQSWEIELSALLCQIGAVTVPNSILLKWQTGIVLKEGELEIIRSIPRLGRQLIKNIPRMERIADAVGYQDCVFSGNNSSDLPTGEAIPVLARILKILVDYDRLQENTRGKLGALQALQVRHSEYDPQILEVFRTKVFRLDDQQVDISAKPKMGEKQISVKELKIGMVLSRDVNDETGLLIISKGTSITEVLMYKLINYFRSQAINSPVYIESD